MHCPRCGLPIAADDNYCRKCGLAINVIDVPALRSRDMPARAWDAARPAITRGIALMAAGAVLRVVIGQAAKFAFPHAFPDSSQRLPPFSGGRPTGDGDDIEVLWYRRVRR